jgi:hypothetical protein
MSTRHLVVCAAALVVAYACSPPPEPVFPEDAKRLATLRSKYGEAFVFQLEEPFYLAAKHRGAGLPPDSQLREVFDAFWGQGAPGTYRRSRYYYLDIYDSNGGFVAEYCYDPRRNEVVRLETRQAE